MSEKDLTKLNLMELKAFVFDASIENKKLLQKVEEAVSLIEKKERENKKDVK